MQERNETALLGPRGSAVAHNRACLCGSHSEACLHCSDIPIPVTPIMPPLPHQVGGHDGVMADETGSLVIKPALPREIAFYQLVSSLDAEQAWSSSKTQSESDRRRQTGRGVGSFLLKLLDGNDFEQVESLEPQQALLAAIKPYVPQYFGSLKLHEQRADYGRATDEKAEQEIRELKATGSKETVVLADATYAYKHPNVLDVKLGRILYDESATEEKKQRMEETAKKTTSWESGIRLTGFKTWNATTNEYVLTPKAYGKSISVAQLPEGVQRFFVDDPWASTAMVETAPASASQSAPTSTSHRPSEGLHQEREEPEALADTSTDLETEIDLQPEMRDPVQTPASSSKLRNSQPSLPDETRSLDSARRKYLHNLLRVLTALSDRLDHLIAIFSRLEIRLVGCSLLIVMEGDPESLDAAWKRVDGGKSRGDGLQIERRRDGNISGVNEEDSEEDEAVGSGRWFGSVARRRADKSSSTPVDNIPIDSDPSSSDTNTETSTIQDLQTHHKSTDDRADAAAGVYADSDTDSILEDDADPELIPRPWSIRLIDFAHTRLATGSGPDEGFLLGLQTFKGLVKGRREEIQGLLR